MAKGRIETRIIFAAGASLAVVKGVMLTLKRAGFYIQPGGRYTARTWLVRDNFSERPAKIDRGMAKEIRQVKAVISLEGIEEEK